jgi:hypothetical protein
LRDAGYDVPENPSAKEIETAREKYEMQKDLQDIDPQLIISNSRRRIDSTEVSLTTNHSHDDPYAGGKRSREHGTSSNSVDLVSKKRPPPPDEEEEAEF